jgi:hypothetical protein
MKTILALMEFEGLDAEERWRELLPPGLAGTGCRAL